MKNQNQEANTSQFFSVTVLEPKSALLPTVARSKAVKMHRGLSPRPGGA